MADFDNAQHQNREVVGERSMEEFKSLRADAQRTMQKQKSSLQSLITLAEDRIEEIQQGISEFRQELKAIEAYERARDGKSAATGGRRGASRKTQITNQLKTGPKNRAELLESLGVKSGDKEATAISNTLTAMKKSGLVKKNDDLWQLS